MIAQPTKWEMWADLSRCLGSPVVLICRFEAVRPDVWSSSADLEQVAGDFIARHVLENDSMFFEG